MITSTSNPIIKEIRSLRQKKHRMEANASYVEGLRLVMQAVEENAEIQKIIWSPDLLTSEAGRKFVEEQTQKGKCIVEVSSEVFKSLSEKDGPQGLAAVVKQKYLDIGMLQPVSGDIFIVLDAVQDPGNLGTILRTADATGCMGIILLENSTDAYDPSAVRASMGGIFTQRIVKADLLSLIKWKKQNSIHLIGASDKAVLNYHGFTYQTPLAIFMGSERQGLKPEHLEICDNLVRIPMVGKCDSLNLAVATAVILYEVFNNTTRIM